MRKWIIAIIMMCLFLSINTTSQAAIDGVRLVDYPKNSILYQSLTTNKSLDQLNQIIILPKQPFDQKEASAIITRMGSLPVTILDKINNQGINLKLFTGKLTDNPTASYLAGQTPRGYQNNVTWDDVPGIGGSKVVLVKIGASEKGKGHGSVNLELHEMAHSIDRYVYNDISGTTKFHDIWEKEHNLIFPGNSYFLYPEEYFAESFAMYYLNNKTKELLRFKAPETYHFIKNLN
ncbi:toxin [Paenibacillus sp. BSR1-1]|uniref:anthrax toxin lethal factor-related metalloendopeptidase n=1 Tax=Paenibacillus sp. BSR1-1 TaxID=3020845 RepID=UPI0025B0CF11|nr:toxin [Paenibacillus sp. BSR1-1]MDN3016803.1 toxin [Paenibacillus sp. BSR1-1]